MRNVFQARRFVAFALIGLFFFNAGCDGDEPQKPTAPEPTQEGDAKVGDNENEDAKDPAPKAATEMKLATFGSGCFWCTEAVFEDVRGVEQVVSGYSGGHVKNPTYEEICGKKTGHAEVVQLKYDPAKITYKDLLEIFWQTHDPTTLNRQGADEGPQYRSVVFYHDDEQKELAEKYKKKLDEERIFGSKIVTEITKYTNFYTAEGYHQNFYKQNPFHGYCRAVVGPKVEKFRKVFKDKLKKD